MLFSKTRQNLIEQLDKKGPATFRGSWNNNVLRRKHPSFDQSGVLPENPVDSIFTDTEYRFIAIVVWAVFIVEPVLAP